MTGAERTARVMARADELGRISEEDGRLTRRFATPALVEAGRVIAGWMEAAGLEVAIDAVGNVRGRNGVAGAPLVIGSHYDTVRDAGRYDGPLGVLCAIEVAAALGETAGPLEVVAFSDEEGTRYAVAYLGSSAYRGRFEPAWLALEDADGVTMAAALEAVGGDGEAATRQVGEPIAGYLEVHIEQGPVLEDEELPVGVVGAIVGQTRIRVELTGRAGHAGTVPAALRADALAGAAELVLAVEEAMKATSGLVATVGELVVEPGAANVIPGEAVLSLDVRHAEDPIRDGAVIELHEAATQLAAWRGLALDWQVLQSTASMRMSATLVESLSSAIVPEGFAVRSLVSGAGHDAVIVGRDAPAAMLFVRCLGGVSHSPLESVEEADVAVALSVLERALRARAQASA